MSFDPVGLGHGPTSGVASSPGAREELQAGSPVEWRLGSCNTVHQLGWFKQKWNPFREIDHINLLEGCCLGIVVWTLSNRFFLKTNLMQELIRPHFWLRCYEHCILSGDHGKRVLWNQDSVGNRARPRRSRGKMAKVSLKSAQQKSMIVRL